MNKRIVHFLQFLSEIGRKIFITVEMEKFIIFLNFIIVFIVEGSIQVTEDF